jgi:hypothetical protein
VDACLLVLCFFRSSFVSISNAFSLLLSQPDPALRFPPQQHIPRHSKQVQQHVTRPMQVDMFLFFDTQQQSTILGPLLSMRKTLQLFHSKV